METNKSESTKSHYDDYGPIDALTDALLRKAMYESTEALDEIFTYSYTLRKAGLDYGMINAIINAILVGCPSISLDTKDGRTEDGKLSESQLNTINILKENGFEVRELPDKSMVMINTHFNDLKNDIDNYLKAKDTNKDGNK